MRSWTRLGVVVIGLLTSAGAFAQAGSATAGDSRATYVYKTVNGQDLLADVYKARTDAPRPTILLLHGGALIFGSRAEVPLADDYLSHGYNIVSVDYRLAPETKLPEIIADVEDAYQWIREEGRELFGADPDRVGVIGHSAGGYLAQVAGYRFRPRPAVVVSFYGYGELTGAWYTAPSTFYSQRYPPITKALAFSAVGGREISSAPFTSFTAGRAALYLYSRQNGLWPSLVADHDPVGNRQWFAAFEPVRNVTASYPPTMLLHGEADTDVPYDESVRMTEALRRAGVAHEFITNPEWGHLFERTKRDESVVNAIARVLGFLDKHMDNSP